ncbi:MAG: adenosine kinase [Gammaproteobacteria bacterium]
MNQTLVCGIGNALVDSEYKVEDLELEKLNLTKGCMELNDYDNHIELSNNLKKSHDVKKIMPGGSVANSLYTLSQFEIATSFIGKIADDDTGNTFKNILQDVGMNVQTKQVNEGITGECLVLITPDHERTMYTHLGVSSNLSVNDINENNIMNCEYLLIEGYLVTSGSTQNVANHCLNIASNNNIKKIITLSDPNVVSFFRDNMIELLENKFDIIFCNKQEALNIAMQESLDDSIKFLHQYANEVVVTCGSEGASVSVNGNLTHEKADPAQPVDLTGAGDMFLAAYLFAKFNNKTTSECIMFSNLCSGKVIEIYGAKLESRNDYIKLKSKL